MARRSWWLPLAVVLGLAGCAGSEQLQPNAPVGGPQASPSFTPPPPIPNPACAPVTAAGIETQINNIYAAWHVDDDDEHGWLEREDAISLFRKVQVQVAAGNADSARALTKKLVQRLNTNFTMLSAAKKSATQTQFNALISALWCYVGISGQVFDLNPGDGVKTFQVTDVAGAQFPANVVSVGTLVSITDLTSAPGSPLLTPLDHYPAYVSIQLYPPQVLPQAAVVVLCKPVQAPAGVLVAHQDDQVGFEILQPTPVPADLQNSCPTSTGMREPTGVFDRLLARAENFFLPKRLEAARSMMFFGGIGGLTSKFSPFGLIDPTLNATDGIGSRTTSFAPRNLAAGAAPKSGAPSAAPPSNPPLPSAYFLGDVGTSTTTGLPFVTIKTPGGDADGSNPIANVTVTFKTSAAQNYDPDSQAKPCRVNGNTVVVQDTVQVKTDANGVATLPCLAFGNVAGFANLSATFDPASLGFPNANLVTINAQDGSSSGGSLNWLVQSQALAASALSLVPPAPPGDAGAGVPLSPQPVLQLRDAFGNEVWQAGATVTATVTSGGGTAIHSPVTTDANGVAAFTDLAIGGAVAGIPQTITYSLNGNPLPITTTVTVTPGPAAKVVITSQPSSAALAGQAFSLQPVAKIEDQYGNVVDSGEPVTASLGSGAAALAGTLTVTAVHGVATFTDLRIDGTIGSRTVKVTAGAFTATTDPITVNAGAPSQLVVVFQPSANATAGVAFANQPKVAIQDQFGNLVTTATGNQVTAAITTGGAPALAGTLTVPTFGGLASFTDLRIDGVTGSRSLTFSSGSWTSAPTGTIVVGPGAATSIKTYFPPAAPATLYNYGTALTPNTNVNPAPQVLVTDAFGNPVGSQPVYWFFSTANGAALTVGSGGTTNASGTAQVSSWLIGEGFNQAIASLYDAAATPPVGYLPAEFDATAVQAGPLFACSVGTNKTDLAPFTIKAPNGTIKSVTLYMSVTGTARAESEYPATLKIYKNSLSGALIGQGGGEIELRGDNGNPTAITFRLSDQVTSAETQGNTTLWFQLTATLPSNRKLQLWYKSGPFANNDPCADAKVYTPSYPTVTTFKQGLSIKAN